MWLCAVQSHAVSTACTNMFDLILPCDMRYSLSVFVMILLWFSKQNWKPPKVVWAFLNLGFSEPPCRVVPECCVWWHCERILQYFPGDCRSGNNPAILDIKMSNISAETIPYDYFTLPLKQYFVTIQHAKQIILLSCAVSSVIITIYLT